MAKLRYLALLVALVPGMTLAAFDTVTHTSGAQIYLTGTGKNYTVNESTRVAEYTVNASTIDFSVSSGSIISLTSSDKSNFSYSATTCGDVSITCGANSSILFIQCGPTASAHTITITPSGTCSDTGVSSPPSGGSPGGGGSSYVAPVIVPVQTPAPVVVPISQPVMPTATGIVLSAPDSAIQIYGITKYSYQPNETLKFSYKYKNEGAKTVTVKITRQLLDSNNKAVKTMTVAKSLKSGATFTGNVQETLGKTLKPGLYMERVRVLNAKNQVLDENSFAINVEKLKSRIFEIGEVASSYSDLAFDGAVLSKVKTGIKLPTSIKLKYSYTNSTDKKHTVRMVRQLIDGSGKVVQTNTGKWVMSVGEKYSQSFTQPLASNLSAGDYTLKIAAYDWTTKELLAENSVGFTIELK